MGELLKRVLSGVVAICRQHDEEGYVTPECLQYSQPLAPTPPTGKPGTAGLITTSFASAAPLFVLENTERSKRTVSQTAEYPNDETPTLFLKLLVRGENENAKRMIPVRRYVSRKIPSHGSPLTHLALMNEIAWSTSFTGMINKTGPKISLRDDD